MKLFIPLLVFFSSFQAFAGDLYFVCSQLLNDDGDEEFLVNKTVESNRIETEFRSTLEKNRFYRVSFEPQTRLFSAIILNESTQKPIRKVSKTLKPAYPVQLSRNVYCVLTD